MGRDMANPKIRVETAETEAAAWHARLGARSVSTRDVEDFFAWKREPANAEAYRRVELIWGETGKLAGDPDIGAAVDAAMTRRGRAGGERRLPRTLIGLAAVGAAALMVVGGWVWTQGRGGIATSVGEQRVVQLADGSSVRLDTDSRIRVRFDGQRRLVELEGGQALFTVAHDTARPFVVAAGDARVTAVGTVFEVRRGAAGASVTLVSGVVDVASGPSETSRRRMTAGNRAEVSAAGAVIAPVDVATETSWTDGRIVFRDTPLRVAVAEVNRYLTDKVELAPGTLDQVRVNGVFKTGDREAFVSTASAVYPLQVSHRADGTVRLTERPK
jgi:transmembrane sensor